MRQGTKPLREGSKLDLPLILAAAFAVLDTHGFDGLSLRLVAKHLEVQPPALYWHVRNKAALINLMAGTFSDYAALSKIGGRDWREKLTLFARGMREVMMRHRDAARLSLAAQPTHDPADVAQRLAAPLMESGLSARQAVSYHASVIAYTLGWVAYEQSQSMHDFLARMINFTESFENGLQAMIDGFRGPS